MRILISNKLHDSTGLAINIPVVMDYNVNGRLVGVEIQGLMEAAYFGNPKIKKPKESLLFLFRSIFNGLSYDETSDYCYIKTRRGRSCLQVESPKVISIKLSKDGRIDIVKVYGVPFDIPVKIN